MPTLRTTNRQHSFESQHRICYYCGQEMWLIDPDAFAARWGLTRKQIKWLKCTAEHLVAQRDGGTDEASNIVAACLFCNTRRHKGRCHRAPDPSTYRLHVARRMAFGKWHLVRLRRRP